MIAAGFMVSACGGGGGGSSVSPGIPTSKTTAAPSTTNATAVAPATFSVSFLQYAPVQTSAHRRAQFISPATQSIVLTLVSVNGSAPSSPVTATLNVGASDTGCTTSGAKVTCSTSFNAPVGNDVLTAASCSGPNGAGCTLGTATVADTVQSNATNAIALDIGGVIANLQMFLVQSSFTQGTAAQSLVVIVPLDSSGAQIVNPGNYSPSISVNATGNSAFSLILDGAASGTSATVTSPSDQLALAYSGATTGSTEITATAGMITAHVNASASAVAGPPGLSSNIGSVNTSSTPNHYQFTSLSQTGTLTVSGGTAPYTVTSSDTTVATVSSPTISGGSSVYTVTPTGYGTNGLGTATLTITDSASPTPAVRTESVTVVPPTLTATVASCGSSATCSSSSESFTNGVNSGLASSVTLSGGIGTYAYVFVSSGTTTSQYVTNVSLSGNTLSFTPTGGGSDVIEVTSGSQTYLFALDAVAAGTAFYSIASMSHAYSPSANNVTLSYNSSSPGNVTLTTAAGNGPWTATSSNPSVAAITGSQGGFIVTATSAGTATITLTPSTGTAPAPLAVTVLPNLSVSAATVALHATGDTFAVNVTGDDGSLAIGSTITESSGGTVINLGSYSGGTLYASAVTSPADQTGAATITFHDTNVDRKVTKTVSLDDTFDLAIRSAINDLNLNGTQQSRVGLTVGKTSTYTLPSTVTLPTVTSGSISSYTYNTGTYVFTLSPTAANNGVIQFNDALGGSVTYPYTAFSFAFDDPGSAVNAAADEAFTYVGEADAVNVYGLSGSAAAISSDASVVSTSVSGNTVTLTANKAGTATITVEDTGTSATTTFTVSVTTTTIPINSRARH